MNRGESLAPRRKPLRLLEENGILRRAMGRFARSRPTERADFLSSPFSLEAIELLDKLGVPAWKVGSGELRSCDLMAAMMVTRKPILYSTGLATWSDIGAVVENFRMEGNPFALFQCTSKYPVSLEQVGLNIVDEMRARFDCPVGLSDHSGTVEPSLAAVARGVDMLEVHVTFDKRMFRTGRPRIDDLRRSEARGRASRRLRRDGRSSRRQGCSRR